MQEKYIDLLVNKCMDLERSKVVFISYNKEIKDFIDKLVNKLKSLGANDIYLDEIDQIARHNILKSIKLEEISNSDYFDCSVWDEYAKKDANFIIFETVIPHLMDDIDPKKLSLVVKKRIETKPLYRKMQGECKLLWTIAAFPGESWAKHIFGDNDSYSKLENSIYNICMLDSVDPIKSWDEFLKNQEKIIERLNSLKIKKLHYSNSLGTDLIVYLPNNYRYSSALDNKVLVNMPSYEVFVSPVYDKTEGIVYSSKPLIYNGSLIDEFFLKFKQGKVVEYAAKVGNELLKEIIEADNYACYLGEAALVEVDSPIARLGITFGTTLIDENASCHLALGSGFSECIETGIDLTEEELRDRGINISKSHVDFMIGTDDLNIVGYTEDNKEIKIFVAGHFSNEILG